MRLYKSIEMGLQLTGKLLLVLGILSALQLQACGWRLRGAIDFPQEIETIYVKGAPRYSDLGVAIHSAFAGTNSRLVSRPEVAKAILNILSNRAEKRIIATDSSGRASEYEVAYLLQFGLTDLEGRELVRVQQVRAKREYRFDPSNVLASDSEVARLEKEMIRASVQQMLLRINAAMRKKQQQKSQKD